MRAALVGAFVLALAACGGDASTSDTSAPPPGTSAPLPGTSTFGVTQTLPVVGEPTPAPATSTCFIYGSTPDGEIPSSVVPCPKPYSPDDIVAPDRALGHATPAVVRPGDSISIRPSAVVHRRCAEASMFVWQEAGSTPAGAWWFVGWIGGTWQPRDTPPTFLACGSPDSDRPETFRVPAVPNGTYRICLWDLPDACADFAVES